MLRLSNPLGAAVSSILVFGTQLLALTEDGSRLFVWDTVAGGPFETNRTSRASLLTAL